MRRVTRIVVAVVLAAMLYAGLAPLYRLVAADLAVRRAATTRQAIQRAAIQCYDVEGVYPATLAYLEDHYGVMVNHDRFLVSYECVASNQMPTVKVIVRGQ